MIESWTCNQGSCDYCGAFFPWTPPDRDALRAAMKLRGWRFEGRSWRCKCPICLLNEGGSEPDGGDGSC